MNENAINSKIKPSFTLERKINFKNGRKSQNSKVADNETENDQGRTPRISKLMALAIHFEQLVQNGTVKDYADLARLGHVTRARMSQIMNLNLLAPDIQEALLFLTKTQNGRDKISESEFRKVTQNIVWSDQRKIFKKLITP